MHDAMVPKLISVVDVMSPLVVAGKLNKEIAHQLGTAENTIKVHRSRAVEKMHAQSVAELVRMMEKIEGVAKKAS
jgi:FixJ family two-component response regulator